MNNEYAILLKRVMSDDTINFYAYEAEKIVKGKSDTKNNTFICDNNEEIISYGNKKILNKSNKKFVGLILTEEELLNSYSDAKTINEALRMYLIDAKKVMTVVSYNYNTNELSMSSIDKLGIINIMNNTKKSDNIIDYEINEDIEEEQPNLNYEKLVSNMSGDFSIITELEYYHLLKLNDKDKMISYLKDIVENKNNKEKLANINPNETFALILPDITIKPFYYMTNVIEIKKNLVKLNEIFIGKRENDIYYPSCFIEKFYDAMDDILMIKEIDILKEALKNQLIEINNIKKQFSFLKDSNIVDLTTLLNNYTEKIEKLLNLKSVSAIDKAYKNLYKDNEILMIKAGITIDILSNSKNFNLNNNKINGDYIIDFFNKSFDVISSSTNIDEIRDICIEMDFNFSSFVDTLLVKSDIEIEKDELLNILESIRYAYEVIASSPYLDNVDEAIVDAKEYVEEDIHTLARLYDEIMERKDEEDKNISDKKRKEIITENILKKIEKPYNELQQLVGLEDLKEHVDKLIKERVYDLVYNDGVSKRNKKYNYFFSGNPGTGKTTVAIILCEILAKLGCIKKNKIKKTTASDFIAGYVGQTAIKTKKLIDEYEGGVIFLDEAYALAQNGGASFTQDVFGELLPAVADGKISLILAGYNDEMKNFLDSNTGVKDRINYFFEFKDYSLEELIEMFNRSLSKYDYKANSDAIELFRETIEEETSKKNFGNGRVVENFTNKILDAHEANMVDNDNLNNEEITVLDIENAKLKDTIYKEKVKKLGF